MDVIVEVLNSNCKISSLISWLSWKVTQQNKSQSNGQSCCWQADIGVRQKQTPLHGKLVTWSPRVNCEYKTDDSQAVTFVAFRIRPRTINLPVGWDLLRGNNLLRYILNKGTKETEKRRVTCMMSSVCSHHCRLCRIDLFVNDLFQEWSRDIFILSITLGFSQLHWCMHAWFCPWSFTFMQVDIKYLLW